MTVPIFTTPIFEVRDVTYRYHEVTALDGLNLTIMPGQRIALLGSEWFRKINFAQHSRRTLFSAERQRLILRRASDRRSAADFGDRIRLPAPSGAGLPESRRTAFQSNGV